MKIVVRGANWVGDAVMTIPAMRALRGLFPEAQITLHTRAWADGIFRDADFIDRILTIPTETSAFKSKLSQVRLLKQENFDVAILFPNSFETALIAKLSKIQKRFGYAKEARSLLLTKSFRIPKWKNDRHEVYFHLNLIEQIEFELLGTRTTSQSEPKFELKVSEQRANSARSILENNGVNLSKKTIVFSAGSTNSRAKRWSALNFAALNDLTQAKLDANVILIGDASELEVSLDVQNNSKIKPIVLTGKTTIDEVTAILANCDLLVSNDTGPAHISAALGTKTLVIFGPTNPKTTQPWGSTMIREDVDCSPCMLRDCPIDHRCMVRITPQTIFENVSSML